MKKIIKLLLAQLIKYVPTDCLPPKMKVGVYKPDKALIKYSHQASVLIDNLPHLSTNDLEEWFYSGLTIGGSNVVEYLLDIERQKKETKHGTK